MSKVALGPDFGTVLTCINVYVTQQINILLVDLVLDSFH